MSGLRAANLSGRFGRRCPFGRAGPGACDHSQAWFECVLETLARAGCIVVNNRLPEYVYPKDDQVYVQCWHGAPLKRLGYDVEIEMESALNTTNELAERFGMDARKWTHLLSPSPYASKHLADAFGLPLEKRGSVIVEEGYPRNDALVRSRGDESVRARLRDSLGVPEGKRVLLYAPTWRDDSYQDGVGYTFDYLLDFDLMRQQLGDEWVVLFRPHYYIANQFDFSAYEGFVIDVSKVDDVNDLYLASDVLLTDYSSVMFDYANLRSPSSCSCRIASVMPMLFAGSTSTWRRFPAPFARLPTKWSRS